MTAAGTAPGAEDPPKLHALLAQAAVLAVAFAGGWAASASGAPAGWMSGAMIAVTAFAATGLAKPFAAPLRDFVILLAGVSMGSGASPHALAALAHYPVSLAMMALAVAAMTASAYAVLVRSPGFSRQTALYAAIPGALSYVFVAAQGTGADMPRIAVAQVFRIFVLMAIVPLLAGRLAPVAPIVTPDSPLMTLALVAAAAAIAYGMTRLRLPAALLYAAIGVSVLAHGSGWRRAARSAIQIAAQALVGAWVGRASSASTGICCAASLSRPRRLRRRARRGGRFRCHDRGADQGFLRPGARRLRARRHRGDDDDGLCARPRSTVRRRPSPGAVFPHQPDAAVPVEAAVGSRRSAADVPPSS